MTARLLKKILALHRTLGAALAVLVLMWTLTGILHPIMSATQPQPNKRMPPPQLLNLSQQLALPDILSQQRIEKVAQVQAIQLSPEITAYRVLVPNSNEGLYFNSSTGALIEDGEQQDAERLATWYTGKTANAIKHSDLVTAFDDDYPYVNRLLPVWRVEFKDGLRAYVDPSQSRLATLSNDQKMWMARIFRLGHSWLWGQHAWFGQSILMKAVLVGLMTLTLAGLFLFFKIHNRQNHRLQAHPARRFHRSLGVGLSAFILMWVFSGFYHIWHTKHEINKPAAYFLSQSLTQQVWQHTVAQPMQRLALVPIARTAVDAQAGWLIQPIMAHDMQGSMTAMKEHQHHGGHKPQTAPVLKLVNATTGEVLSPLQQARQLAAFYTDISVNRLASASWVTQFGGEYGFVNKRLPVIKVETSQADGLRVYIEPISGVLAAQVTDADANEGWSFAYLHKWSWFTGEKWLKDTLMATTAGLIALLVCLGLRLWWLKRKGSI